MQAETAGEIAGRSVNAMAADNSCKPDHTAETKMSLTSQDGAQIDTVKDHCKSEGAARQLQESAVERRLAESAALITITHTFSYPNEAARDAAVAAFPLLVGASAQSLQAALGYDSSITVLSAAYIESIDIVIYYTVDRLTDEEVAGIISGSIILFCLLCVVLPFLVIRMKLKKSKETMVVPA